MTRARGFRTNEARFTPITAVGVLAIIGLSGVLVGSVLQGAAGGGSPAPRVASQSARSQAATAAMSVAATQAAVVPVPSAQPAISTTSVPAVGASTAGIAGPGVVSAAAVAPTQASVSSQHPTSIAGASVTSTRITQMMRTVDPQAVPAPAAGAHFTTNAASVATIPVGGASASHPNVAQAVDQQVLGGVATNNTGASSGLDTTTGSGSGSGSSPDQPVNTNPPFPSVQRYTGAITTQAQGYQALGLPADFQFGGEPDPYIVGSYQTFVTDAANGDAAAQAGLDLAMSQGANFTGFN